VNPVTSWSDVQDTRSGAWNVIEESFTDPRNECHYVDIFVPKIIATETSFLRSITLLQGSATADGVGGLPMPNIHSIGATQAHMNLVAENGKCLEPENGIYDAETDTVLADCEPGKLSQMWQWSNGIDGRTAQLRNVASEKCIDCDITQGRHTQKCFIQDCYGTNKKYQQWFLPNVLQPSNAFELMSMVSFDRVKGEGDSCSPGTNEKYTFLTPSPWRNGGEDEAETIGSMSALGCGLTWRIMSVDIPSSI